MKFHSLHELYIKELHDLYDAENQIVKALPKMIEASNSSQLRSALSDHLEQTKDQLVRLEQVFRLHNEEAEGETCKGISGIINEGKDIVKHDENPDVRDAGIISAAQRVEHYEMAAYGTVRTWAQQMGHTEAAELLQQSLDEEGEADKRLTEIAMNLNVVATRQAG
jgi:ferritin-like metal-binding protein YciE